MEACAAAAASATITDDLDEIGYRDRGERQVSCFKVQSLPGVVSDRRRLARLRSQGGKQSARLALATEATATE
jgi:hypothetical protein